MAPEPLLIVGAGPLAREALAVLDAARSSGDEAFEVLGLLDDDPAARGAERFGTKVLGGLEVVDDHPSARVLVCTGSPRNWWSRTQIVDRLALDDDRWATVVHPSAELGTGTAVGPGSLVLAGVVATAGVDVGRHVVVMPGVVLTHDDAVADGVTFGSGVRLGGAAAIGRGAYVGAGALVREGVRVGEWSLVGMGALVLDDVPPGEVWIGTPARRLRDAPVPAELRGGAPG